MRLIDADALMDYCDNQKSKTISNNDIARFPTIEPSKQVTSKLNNPCDSLLTDDSDGCKEHKSKLDSDLISREDAMEAVYKLLWDEPPYCDSEALCRERAKEIVNALPSAEAVHKPDYSYEADMVKRLRQAKAVQGWGPCSERLPSESGDYLCTIPLDADETYTEVLTFHKGRFYEDDDEWGATYHDDVLAWMPLPKPYREDGEE